MEIMSVLNNVYMTPDKKVEEYLERARMVIANSKVATQYDLGNIAFLEIAKMIQLEEHRVPYQEEIIRKIVDDWNKRAKENLEEMGRQANKPNIS